MAEHINIEAREHVEKRITMEAKAGDNYTESTGNKETTKYTGTWEQMLTAATGYLSGGGDGVQISCELERLEGGIGELTVTRERFTQPSAGSEGGGDTGSGGDGGDVGTEENPSYSSGGTLVPVSILCHPKFADLCEKELRALKAMLDGQDENSLLTDDDGNATAGKRIKDMIGSDAGRKAMEYIRKGVKEWPELHTQMTARWKGRSNKYTLRDIVASVPGGVVSTPSGCNWRVDGVGTEKHGNEVWQTVTFTLSGRGGWDEYLYQSGS